MEDRFGIETKYIEEGFRVAGVDEVGRGPLAGPVVAAAVIFNESHSGKWWDEITDSKKLSEKKREILFSFITQYGDCSIGVASEMEIESLNILQASLLAMRRAVENFFVTSLRRHPGRSSSGSENEDPSRSRRAEADPGSMGEDLILLIDGKFVIPELSVKQEAIVKGDSLVHSIAASSIVAKVTRDRMMKELDEKFPEYGFAQNKGYGTKIHMDAIHKYGLSPVHRPSFCGNILAR